VINFEILKLIGYIFQLHLTSEFENVESSAVIVKFVSVTYVILVKTTPNSWNCGLSLRSGPRGVPQPSRTSQQY